METITPGSYVRCIDVSGYEYLLVKGLTYKVLDVFVERGNLIVVDIPHKEFGLPRFEPVGNESEPQVTNIIPFKRKEPVVLDNDNSYACDVDGTLVIWDETCFKPGDGKIALTDPYTNTTVYLKPHQKHINLVKSMHARGRQMIVWSAGGKKWADTVVKAVGLDEYVPIRMAKFQGFIDDLPANDVLVNRIFLSDAVT